MSWVDDLRALVQFLQSYSCTAGQQASHDMAARQVPWLIERIKTSDVFVCDEPFVLARRSLLLVLVAAAVHVATIRPQAQRWPRFPLLDLFLLDWVPLSRLALGQWETRHRLRMWIRILHTHQMGPW